MSTIDALDVNDVHRLIAVATFEDPRSADLGDRRRGIVAALVDIVNADAGHWAWGRGNPETNSIAPVALVDFGYTDQQRALMIEHAMNPQCVAMFQARMTTRFDENRQAAATRRDIIPDAEWRSSPPCVDYVARSGLDSWVHAVRYRAGDTWSCLHMLRRRGKPEFEARQAALLQLALSSVAWLSSAADETLPGEAFKQLTPRQRTVMLMVLDGMSRKHIATQLDLSEHTVDDHLKALYSHFNVRSVSELAARFLRRL